MCKCTSLLGLEPLGEISELVADRCVRLVSLQPPHRYLFRREVAVGTLPILRYRWNGPGRGAQQDVLSQQFRQVEKVPFEELPRGRTRVFLDDHCGLAQPRPRLDRLELE